MSSAQPLWLLERVDRQAEDLHVALVELGLDLRHVAELGRAHRREVLRVREQHAPAVAEVLVELDRAFGGLRREVGGFVAQAQRHRVLSLSSFVWKRRQARSRRREKCRVALVGIRNRRRTPYDSRLRAVARSPSPAGSPSTSQPLRESRDFRLLWSGELISQIGTQITVVALFVQVVLDLTNSSAAVGVIGLVQLVPMVLVSPSARPADRPPRPAPASCWARSSV